MSLIQFFSRYGSTFSHKNCSRVTYFLTGSICADLKMWWWLCKRTRGKWYELIKPPNQWIIQTFWVETFMQSLNCLNSLWNKYLILKYSHSFWGHCYLLLLISSGFLVCLGKKRNTRLGTDFSHWPLTSWSLGRAGDICLTSCPDVSLEVLCSPSHAWGHLLGGSVGAVERAWEWQEVAQMVFNMPYHCCRESWGCHELHLKMGWRKGIAACTAHCLNPVVQFFVPLEEDRRLHLAGELVNWIIPSTIFYHHQNCPSGKKKANKQLQLFKNVRLCRVRSVPHSNTISTAGICFCSVWWIFQVKAFSPHNINFIDA